MKEKCYTCEKGELVTKKTDYLLYGIKLGRFSAEVCSRCGEIFFDETTSEKMTELAKEKGLWGLAAKTKLGQSGSTLDIRLPKSIIKFMSLKKGKEIFINPESKNRLIIEISGNSQTG